MLGLKHEAQQGLNIVHHTEKGRVKVAEKRHGERTQDAWMHKARTGSKQDPVRGDKILNSHKTLEKDTKGLSIADSSLTQPYVACPGETSLLSRGFWLENRHVIVQSIMDDMVTPLPQSSPSRSWWRETNAPPATGTFPGRYSTMVSWIAAIFLTGSFVTVLVVASSTSKIDRFEAPEQALSLMVGRTMDLQEGLTRAPDWEQQLMAWVSGDGAAERGACHRMVSRIGQTL